MHGHGLVFAESGELRLCLFLACRDAHADEAARTRGIDQRLLLIRSSDERVNFTIDKQGLRGCLHIEKFVIYVSHLSL